jgi:hypothetical protein
MLLVVSVSVTSVYETDASFSVCPDGQLISLGGGLTVSDAVTLPFLPELKVPVAVTGPLTVVLFLALGVATAVVHTDVCSCAICGERVVDVLVCPETRFLELGGQ